MKEEERQTPEQRRNLSLVYSVRMNRRTLAYDARSESEAIASDSEEGDRGDT